MHTLKRPWSGVAPDGSVLIVRDASAHEIYALELQLPKAVSNHLQPQRLLGPWSLWVQIAAQGIGLGLLS